MSVPHRAALRPSASSSARPLVQDNRTNWAAIGSTTVCYVALSRASARWTLRGVRLHSHSTRSPPACCCSRREHGARGGTVAAGRSRKGASSAPSGCTAGGGALEPPLAANRRKVSGGWVLTGRGHSSSPTWHPGFGVTARPHREDANGNAPLRHLHRGAGTNGYTSGAAAARYRGKGLDTRTCSSTAVWVPDRPVVG